MRYINKSLNNTNLSDGPVYFSEQDILEVEPRIVNKIFNFLKFSYFSQLTIAVTGEWGIGKTSAINLLINKIKETEKNSLVILFEPLLDGKYEINDILQLFYFKLYKCIVTDNELKKVIKNAIKSMALLTRMKISGNVGLSADAIDFANGKAGFKIEYDLSKNIDDLLSIWEKEKPKNFSEQIEEINKVLIKKGYKLYIVIDEIDRLPANYIINLLLFVRSLELIDNLICIVGIDYKQTISKLIKEKSTGLYDYDTARSYIDKLFQNKFDVYHNKYTKINFTLGFLKNLDREKIFENILNSEDYENRIKLGEIIDYLSTPRQIKKWLVSVIANYLILKHSPNKLDVLAFLATLIKHPIISDNISKHTLKMLNKDWDLLDFVDNKYATNFFDTNNDKDIKKQILIVSTGIKSSSIKENKNLKTLLNKITLHPIEDIEAEAILHTYLKSPEYLIMMLFEGIIDESKIALYSDFFGKNINLALDALTKDDNNMDLLASDLSEILSKNKFQINTTPSLKLLIQLWDKRITDDKYINPYLHIVYTALKKLPLEQIISESPLALSENHIHSILQAFGINNNEGNYELKIKFGYNSPEFLMKDVIFNDVMITSFTEETIKNILNLWLDEVENKLINQSAFSEKLLTSVFYRYIQWGNALTLDNRKKLSNFLISYLNDEKIGLSSKIRIIELITKQCGKYHIDKRSKNPIYLLFDNDKDLIEILLHIGKKHNVKNIKDIESLLN